MILSLLLVLTLLPCTQLNAMLTNNGSFAQTPVHMTNATCLVHRAVYTHPITGKAQADDKIPVQSTLTLDHDRYQQKLATTLEHIAVGLINPAKPDDIIKYLIAKIDPAFIKNPEELLIATNHPALFEYIEKTFGATCTARALQSAIAYGQHENVEKLLDASVNIKGIRPALVYAAFSSFSPNDDATTTAQRLATLKAVLNRAAIKDVPAVFELNLSTLPAHVQGQIEKLLNERLYPPRLTMGEDDSETPLHRAAAAGDYKTCFSYLTEWSGPLTEDSLFPHDATDAMAKHNSKLSMKDQAPEVRAASQRLSAFTVNMGDHYKLRFGLAETQRTAKNSQGLTPQEVAIAAKAQAKLIKLLDPKNDKAISTTIYSNYEQRSMTEQPACAKPVKQQKAQKNTHKKEKPTLKGAKEPLFKVGDVVEIYGVKYEVTEIEKVK